MARRLSARLSLIAKLVPQGCFLADVGSDHAWLPIYLVENGKIEWAMAIDNKVGPFLRMKENVDASEAKNRIICSRSDGIEAITDNVDALALCGIGGLLSCDILEAHPEKLKRIETIIMDPHRDLIAVRKRVSALGFHLEDEAMIKEDGIYYTVLKFVKGSPERPYTPQELALGPILLTKDDPTHVEWLQEQKSKIEDLLKKDLSKEKREAYAATLEFVLEALKAKGQVPAGN